MQFQRQLAESPLDVICRSCVLDTKHLIMASYSANHAWSEGFVVDMVAGDMNTMHHCIKTSGSSLLMRQPQRHLYLLSAALHVTRCSLQRKVCREIGLMFTLRRKLVFHCLTGSGSIR